MEDQVKPVLHGYSEEKKEVNGKLCSVKTCQNSTLEKGGGGSPSSSSNGTKTSHSFGIEKRLSLECDRGNLKLCPKLIPFLQGQDQIPLDQWDTRLDSNGEDSERAVANGRGAA